MSEIKFKYEARGALADKDLSAALESLNEKFIVESQVIQGGGDNTISYDMPKREVLVFLQEAGTRQDAVAVAVGYKNGMVIVAHKPGLERNHEDILTLMSEVDPPAYRVTPILDHNDVIDSFVVKLI